MLKAVRQATTVKPGGIIELASTDLPEGASVDVIVVVNEVSNPPLAVESATAPHDDEK